MSLIETGRMHPVDRLILAQTDGGKRIGTARDHLAPIRDRRSSLMGWFKMQAAGRGFPFREPPRGKAKAEINHGHWIVRCSCGGAEEADPLEPVFFCLSCGNADAGGHVLEVEFPADREILEGLLLMRPVENRNWRPGEGVLDLANENREHGVI